MFSIWNTTANYLLEESGKKINFSPSSPLSSLVQKVPYLALYVTETIAWRVFVKTLNAKLDCICKLFAACLFANECSELVLASISRAVLK